MAATILSSVLRAHLADTLLTRLLTYNDEAQTLPKRVVQPILLMLSMGGHYSDPRHF